MTFTVATVNVNGMRAAARKGMGEWLASCGADVVTFQEVRAPEDLVEGLVGQGWRSAAHASMFKGRAGVAIAVREGLEGANVGEVRRLLPNLEADSHTGRWLELDVEDPLGDGMDLTVISMYMHSGNVDKPQTMADKYEMLEGAWSRLEELGTSGRHVLLTGDLNIAHTNLDIKNWKGNLKSAGFLPEERAYIDRLLEAGNGLMCTARSLAMCPGRTRGGRSAGKPSITIRAGGSTTTWPPRSSPRGRRPHASTGLRATTRAGVITPHSS